jgi:predicted nucleic acid-binding protein
MTLTPTPVARAEAELREVEMEHSRLCVNSVGRAALIRVDTVRREAEVDLSVAAAEAQLERGAVAELLDTGTALQFVCRGKGSVALARSHKPTDRELAVWFSASKQRAAVVPGPRRRWQSLKRVLQAGSLGRHCH